MQWNRTISASELANGSMQCLTIASRRILLARCDDHYYAADEMCTHEDASLCLGALRDARVKCPLHGSWFDLKDGSVSEEPATEALQIYPVRVVDGWLEVQL